MDPAARSSEGHGWFIGIFVVTISVVLLVMGAISSSDVWLRYSNQKLSEPQLVRAVTANVVKRPSQQPTSANGQPASTPAVDKGQADCPT